jgi:hypothetical protein
MDSPCLYSGWLGHPLEKNHCHRDVLACPSEGRQLFVVAIIADAPLDIAVPEAICSDVVVPALSLDGGVELS